MTLFPIKRLPFFILFIVSLNAYTQWSPFGSAMPQYVIGFERYHDTLYAYSQPSPYVHLWNGNDWDTLSPRLPLAGGIHMFKNINDTLFALPYATSAGNHVYMRQNNAWQALGGEFKNVGAQPAPTLYDIILYNNEIYVSGEFNRVDDDTINGIAKWNGNAWVAVGTGFSTGMAPFNNTLYPHQMWVYNNQLMAVGNFAKAGGVTVNGIAAWNGQQWSAFGSGFNKIVYCVTDYNGDLYAGGEFTQAGANSLGYVAKWNGSAWVDPGLRFGKVDLPGNVFVHTLKTIDNKLYIAGGYDRVTTASGIHKSSGITGFNGTEADTLWGGTNGDTEGVIAHQGGILAGGGFTQAGGTGVHNVALWFSTAGIESVENVSGFAVYPSPAAEQLFLKNIPAKASHYQIVSMDGHRVAQEKIRPDISVAHLKKGVYFLQLMNGNVVVEVRKFVKM